MAHFSGTAGHSGWSVRACAFAVCLVDCAGPAGDTRAPLQNPFAIKDCVYAGRREFVGETKITCGAAKFEAGAEVRIQGGATFKLIAESIEVQGSARIDGTGGTGAAGAAGAPYPEASPDKAWLAPSDAEFQKVRQECTTNPDHPWRGGPGAPGGRGGPGAHVYLTAFPSGGILSIQITGGKGGPGGEGGSGRMIRKAGGPGCEDCKAFCISGPKGRDGARGDSGFYKIAPPKPPEGW